MHLIIYYKLFTTSYLPIMENKSEDYFINVEGNCLYVHK